MEMNLPNKLTVFRILLVPVFMVFQLLPVTKWHMLFALACFIVASVTDLIDGRLARKNNQVTDFGKLMDPLADKILVCAALVDFVQLGLAGAWVAMVVIAREFLVTSLRLIASGKGVVIAANIWGKIKTNSQMIAIVVVMLLSILGLPRIIGDVCLWIAAGFTVISGVQYLYAYREYIDAKK